LLAANLAACTTPAVVTAPGKIGVPLGPHVTAGLDLSGIALRSKLVTVDPADEAATFHERAGFLYATLPRPAAVGFRLTYRKEF
jgi:hypothetical protein